MMLGKRKWSNIPGKLSVELYRDEGELLDADDDQAAPDCLQPYVQDDGSTLVIEFRSSGYYEPAEMYGGPDNLGHDAEGDDDRTMELVHVVFAKEGVGKWTVDLPKEVQEEVFEFYHEQIDEVEIETEE